MGIRKSKKDRSEAAKKAAATRKRNANKRSRAAKKGAETKRKQSRQLIAGHPFPPGTEVAVHFSADVHDYERQNGVEPAAESVAKGEVAEDGSLEIAFPRPESYAVTGRIPVKDRPDEYRTMTVGVK